MERDKATLPWTSGDLLDHAIARLRALTRDVRILSGRAPRYTDRGLPVLTDAVTDVGAMAALVTALRAIPDDDTALLLAVDVPLASEDLLRHLVLLAERADAVVPASSRGAEPFCAVYKASCRAAVERALAEKRYKMTAFWPDVTVREVGTAELSGLGDPQSLFLNVNTPADYERARTLDDLTDSHSA
jgi:molybdopterin-guanine dinucleotide biosynthesis protein A